MGRNYVEFVNSFEACDIDASDFGHLDHVGTAYEMLRRYDFLKASVTYADCINTIATNAGAAKKFNTTITLAFLSIIAERMQQSTGDSFEAFMTENQDLISGNVLKKWYTDDRLQSDMARQMSLMPDVAA